MTDHFDLIGLGDDSAPRESDEVRSSEGSSAGIKNQMVFQQDRRLVVF
jgi:hypothetical protein